MLAWQLSFFHNVAARRTHPTSDDSEEVIVPHTAVVLSTHLGGEDAPEILAHGRLYLEDRLVGRRAQVYPAVV